MDESVVVGLWVAIFIFIKLSKFCDMGKIDDEKAAFSFLMLPSEAWRSKNGKPNVTIN